MDQQFDALLQENRKFPPSEDFRREANIHDPEIWAKAAADREGFWAGWAEQLDWQTKWDRRFSNGTPPNAKWFVGGKLNASLQLPRSPSGNARRQAGPDLGR